MTWSPPPAVRPTNSLAVISLVGGIASFMGFLCVGAIVGIACGHLARQQIRATGEDGDGLAVAGMVLGYAHLAMLAIGVLIWLFLFGGIIALTVFFGGQPH